MPVAWAALGTAVIGGVASMSASNKQAGAANRATDLQGRIFDKTQENLSPYMSTGSEANTTLAHLLGIGGNPYSAGYGSLTKSFTPQDYLNNQDPGYGFQLHQGQMALQNSQAAQNGVLSGAALKDLVSYNQGMAASSYQDAWNRWMSQNTNTFNRLSGLASLGENAAAGVGNVGAQTGANMANTITGAGNAAAAGQIGAANAISGGINNAAAYWSLFGNHGGGPSGGGYQGPGAGFTNDPNAVDYGNWG